MTPERSAQPFEPAKLSPESRHAIKVVSLSFVAGPAQASTCPALSPILSSKGIPPVVGAGHNSGEQIGSYLERAEKLQEERNRPHSRQRPAQRAKRCGNRKLLKSLISGSRGQIAFDKHSAADHGTEFFERML
jgi:hypothetical protein